MWRAKTAAIMALMVLHNKVIIDIHTFSGGSCCTHLSERQKSFTHLRRGTSPAVTTEGVSMLASHVSQT